MRQRNPRYRADVMAATQAVERGKVYTIMVQHDNDCGIWRGKSCNCAPIVREPQEVREVRA